MTWILILVLNGFDSISIDVIEYDRQDQCELALRKVVEAYKDTRPPGAPSRASMSRCVKVPQPK